MLVFVGLFAICWLPSHVIYLYRSYHYDQVDTSLCHFIASVCARILAFTNSCVNPFALYLMSKSFSKHFKKQLLCCSSPRRSDCQTSASTNVTAVWKYSSFHKRQNTCAAARLESSDEIQWHTCLILIQRSQYQCDECSPSFIWNYLLPLITSYSDYLSNYTMMEFSHSNPVSRVGMKWCKTSEVLIETFNLCCD